MSEEKQPAVLDWMCSELSCEGSANSDPLQNQNPDAAEIRKLCHDAGMHDLTDDFIFRGLNSKQVRNELVICLAGANAKTPKEQDAFANGEHDALFVGE